MHPSKVIAEGDGGVPQPVRSEVIEVDIEVWMREHELRGSTVMGGPPLLVEHPAFRNLF